MIYTSYFAKYRGNKACNIALYPPKGFKGFSCEQLYPPKKLLNWFKAESAKLERITNVEDKIKARREIELHYEAIYRRDVLGRIDVHSVAAALDGYVLLCYEKVGSFCHRNIVAQWLIENGYKCEELIYLHELNGGIKR